MAVHIHWLFSSLYRADVQKPQDKPQPIVKELDQGLGTTIYILLFKALEVVIYKLYRVYLVCVSVEKPRSANVQLPFRWKPVPSLDFCSAGFLQANFSNDRNANNRFRWTWFTWKPTDLRWDDAVTSERIQVLTRRVDSDRLRTIMLQRDLRPFIGFRQLTG